MEILFGIAIVAISLIVERLAVKRANKYADRVVRRYTKNEREDKP